MENESAVQRVDASMPTIALETSLRSKRQLGLLLGVHGPHTPRGKQIANGFVRLVEKTILEYQSSRERLLAFLKDGIADDYFRAQDHFETSTQSLHRAITYLDRLRGMGFRQVDGTAFVPRPRELEVLRDDIKAKVRELRDFIEHLDQDIVGERIPPEAEIGMHLGWEKASLNGAEITYSDFARWVGQLHHFAVLLSRVHITVGPAPSLSETARNA
jgi:hypothetical protein